jgi:hypothetical protein
MEWWQRAWDIPGQMVLRVALVIRHLKGLNRGKRISFPFSNVEAARWGISRQNKHVCLNALEAAGLIVVQRKRGHAPVITVIEAAPGLAG